MQQKVVIITGCSVGGIGAHLCLELAKRGGWKVYATARDPKKMKELEGVPNIVTRTLDVTKDEQVTSVVAGIVEAEGKIDCIVNNAGGLCIGPIVDIPPSTAQEVFDLNVVGPHRLTRAVFPHMAARRSGLVVNIGSVVGEVPTPWNGFYCAAKAALHSLTENLRSEVAPFGIEVLLVAPAAVQSNISANQAKQREGDEGASILPEGSLYGDFVERIVARLYLSQGKGFTMPTERFTNIVADRMEKKRPGGFLTAGGGIIGFKILGLLPRWLASWVLAKVWVRKGTKSA